MPKENGPQSARWKTKKILIGRQFAGHLIYAQKLEN